MTLIKIDRELLLEELYALRATLTTEEDALDRAKQKLMEIVSLIQNAPVETSKARYPGMRVGRF